MMRKNKIRKENDDKKESNDKKETKNDTINEREKYYLIYEKQTGKKALWKGQETRLFLSWIDNLIKKESETIKCIVRYFDDDNSMICQDFQLKYRDLKLDKNNNIVWSLDSKSKEHILQDIAYTILSIPIFHVVKSSKSSVKLILDNENDDLYDYGCNSFDQYNKLHSDVLSKNLKVLIGKLYNKWTIYFVIFLFFFLITCLPFFPFVFTKYFVS